MINRLNIHNSLINEGGDFYQDLNQIDYNAFNNWFLINSKLLGVFNSFEEVIPSAEKFQMMIERGYTHIGSQCHYSAKAICLLDSSYEYWTGFIKTADVEFPIISHSFNVKNGQIIDFSRIDNNGNIVNYNYSFFPNTYYGIRIPRDFVEQYKGETFKEKSMRPLLYEWYQKCNE